MPEFKKKNLEKTYLDYKKWVKSIQTAGYNGARTVFVFQFRLHLWANKINPRGQWYNHDYNEMSHQDAHFNFSAPLVSVIFDFFALNYWWMNCRVNPDMKFKSKVTKIIKFLEFFIALFKLGLSCSAVNSQGGPSRGLLLFFTS